MVKINQKQKKIKKLSKKDFILIFSSILLIGAISFVVFKFSRQASQFLNPLPQIIGKAVLTIDFGNDKKRAFSGDIIEGENFIDVLAQAAKAGSFSYKLDDKNNLNAIESSVDDKNKSWQWYLNNEKIIKPPSEITPKNGDNILIKYE